MHFKEVQLFKSCPMDKEFSPSSISKSSVPLTEKSIAGISIQGVEFKYHNEFILQNFSAFIPRGKMTCMMGANGAGKTTLLKLIAGLLKPQAGSIQFLGFPSAPPALSYFRQFHELDRDFPLRVIDIVGLSHIDFSPFRLSLHAPHNENCTKNLELLGIAHLRNAFLSQLSQGQIQRVYLARFLAEHGDILLLDEPFNFIDHKTQIEMLGILRSLQNQGKTIITIMHQNPQVTEHFDHTIQIGAVP